MGKDELAFAVFGRLDEHFHLVTDFQVGIVAELRSHDDTFALGADVDDDFALGDGGDGTFNDLVLDDLGEGLVVGLGHFGAVFAGYAFTLEGFPVEIFGSHGGVQAACPGFFFLLGGCGGGDGFLRLLDVLLLELDVLVFFHCFDFGKN